MAQNTAIKSEQLAQTALYNNHVELGAKMVPFAGYAMPINYQEGIIAEYKSVREDVAMFDVSHMGQIILSGVNIAEKLERLIPAQFVNSVEGKCKYTILTNEKGGIIDDLIVTRLSTDRFFAVINAGCKYKDMEHIKANLDIGQNLEYLEDRALIAVQGRNAQDKLNQLFSSDFSTLEYMSMLSLESDEYGYIYLSRTGYTGEDGFEISVTNDKASSVWQALLKLDIKPAGLGARDLLRIEMGYHLYGSDMDEDSNAIDAGLGWTVSKDNNKFIGAEEILPKKLGQVPVSVKRVGLVFSDKVVARGGAIVKNGEEEVGHVTSGVFSPNLQQAVAIAYIKPEFAKVGEKISVQVRNKCFEAEITKMPFVKSGVK